MRTAAGVLAVLCLLASGCTAETPSPVTVPTPPPVSQTPEETAQERQERLDYAAAEKSYRTFRAEYNRVLRAGGAKEPTKVMKATAGGEYLDTFTRVIRSYRDVGSRSSGVEIVRYVKPAGYSNDAVALDVCEDGTKTATVLPSGDTRAGEIRTASIEVRRSNGRWRVWSGSGKLVDTCE